jgi:hypothetical protein
MESVAQVYTTATQNGQSTLSISLEQETYVGSGYNHSTNSQIKVNETGLYKVSYGCVWIEPSNINRQIMENYIRKNGATEITPSKSNCYIRRNNADRNRCSNNGVVLVNLTAGDYIELRGGVYQYESSGEVDTYEDCWMYVELVTNEVAEIYDSDGGDDFGGTTITVDLDSTYYSDSIYKKGSASLNFTEDGWYKIYYTVCSEDISINSRQTPHTWLRKNGATDITPSNSYSHTRENAEADRNCEHAYTMLQLSSGDYLELRHNQKATEGSGTTETIAGQSWLLAEKLKYPKAFVYESSGGQSFSDGTEAAVTFDTESIVDSPMTFDGSSKITINETGYYEINYNLAWEDDGGNDRIIVCAYIKKNGNKL